MAPHSSTLAWNIPWTEKPGGLQSIGPHRVGHNWSDLAAGAAVMHQRHQALGLGESLQHVHVSLIFLTMWATAAQTGYRSRWKKPCGKVVSGLGPDHSRHWWLISSAQVIRNRITASSICDTNLQNTEKWGSGGKGSNSVALSST